MEAMDEDMGDFDEDMPPLIDSDSENDEEDGYMLPFTPRVALGDVFEQLDSGFACLSTCSQQGYGWSAATWAATVFALLTTLQERPQDRRTLSLRLQVGPQ